MKRHFFSTVPQVFCTLLACGALTGTLAAATGPDDNATAKSAADKDSANSSAERLGKAAKLAFTSQAGLKPVGDWAVDPAETQELNDDFASARNASISVQPGPDAGSQRRAIQAELNNELESFLSSHTNSAYGPSVKLFLARVHQLRSGYSEAMDRYRQVWGTVKGSTDATAQAMAWQAAGGLAKLLALTGRLGELDALVAEAQQLYGQSPPGNDRRWAMEMRA